CQVQHAPTQLVCSSPALFIALLAFLQYYVEHRSLHSFPTRRSSDLVRCRHATTAECPRATSTLEQAQRLDECVERHMLSLRYLADRKSTRLNSSHEWISYAVFCLKKKNKN